MLTIGRQRLAQGKQVLAAIVADQGLGDSLLRGTGARVAQFCQRPGIAFSGQNGIDDGHAGLGLRREGGLEKASSRFGGRHVFAQFALPERLVFLCDDGKERAAGLQTYRQIAAADRRHHREHPVVASILGAVFDIGADRLALFDRVP